MFIGFEAARPILKAMGDQVPIALRSGTVDSDRFAVWVRQEDARVRSRLEAGEEDTISNLLRFGVTFTKEYRIDDEYFRRFGESSLVNGFAGNRADDLIRKLGEPNAPQGFGEVRAFLERKGYSIKSLPERARLRRYLLANLSRMHTEFMQAKEDARHNRGQMFRERGISLDTNLWPDYDLDFQFRRMLKEGILKPGGVRRVAIVGPGLDFANKQEGVDFYPPQTVQPFAVMDSLLRLGLAKAEDVEVVTLDISPRVNLHINAARKNAGSGRAYTLQLPWYAAGRWTGDFRSSFTSYWKGLGTQIGEPVAPIPVPAGLDGIETRAVKVRSGMVQRVTPLDINIVYQRLVLAPEQRFDLVIGTNIFVYYGVFEQALAMTNIAAILKPGGYLLTNDKLPEAPETGFRPGTETAIPMTTEPVITDYIISFKRGS